MIERLIYRVLLSDESIATGGKDRFFSEFVAKAPNGGDELWLGRIVLDLGPQPVHQTVDGVFKALELVAPYQVNELTPAESASRMGGEQGQQFKFLGGEADLPAFRSDRSTYPVDLQIGTDDGLVFDLGEWGHDLVPSS